MLEDGGGDLSPLADARAVACGASVWPISMMQYGADEAILPLPSLPPPNPPRLSERAQGEVRATGSVPRKNPWRAPDGRRGPSNRWKEYCERHIRTRRDVSQRAEARRRMTTEAVCQRTHHDRLQLQVAQRASLGNVLIHPTASPSPTRHLPASARGSATLATRRVRVSKCLVSRGCRQGEQCAL